MSFYDVKDYGAKPDGKNVNTASIQAAIDDCAKNGGGTVCVNGGVFVVASVDVLPYFIKK